MNKTEEVIITMLRENTGRALCDSGGTPKYDDDGNYLGSKAGYGRHHERNKNRSFHDEAPGVIRFSNDYIEFTKNVYAHLVETLEYDPVMDAAFQAFADLPENADKSWFQLVEEFPEAVNLESSDSYNTYNGECALSQTLQFLTFGRSSDFPGEYILLQIHQGADVRGGYTAPRVFRAEDSFFMYNDGCIRCKDDDQHTWSTDDGYHWYDNGAAGRGAGVQLEQYEMVNADEVKGYRELCAVIAKGEEQLIKMQEMYPERADKLVHIHKQSVKKYHKELQQCVAEAADGILIFDDDGNGYCPKCGGQLVLAY